MTTVLLWIMVLIILSIYGASVYKWYREEEEKRNRK